jgi:hypothetical protein
MLTSLPVFKFSARFLFGILLGIVYLFLIVLLGSLPCFATTRTAATCNQSDVATTVALASTGDTTIIPTTGGPTCTWSSSVTSTVSQTIQCAAGVTISLSSSDFIVFQYNNLDNGFERVTGCTITGMNANYAITIQGKPLDFRVDHNTFTNLPKRGVFVGTQADCCSPCYPIYGSIDNNTWSSNGSTSGYVLLGGCNENWRNANTEGTTSVVFVETNTISYTGGGYNNSAVAGDCSSGCQFVFRNNVVYNTWYSTHDTGSTQNSRSTRNFEIYNNTFHCSEGATTNTCGNVMDLRGGTGLIYNNAVDFDVTGVSGFGEGAPTEIYRVGSAGGVPWDFLAGANTHQVCNLSFESIRQYCSTDTTVCYTLGASCGSGGTCTKSCTTNSNCGGGSGGINQCLTNIDGSGTGGYPVRDQTGVGPDGTDNAASQIAAYDPVYVWGNTNPLSSNTLITPFVSVSGADSSYIVANREYYEEASGSFTGSTGVGVGLLSARPSTCTGGTNGGPGVGYWATDTTTLYKCTASNTWTASYTPAAYPNPLAASNGGVFKTGAYSKGVIQQ